MLNALRSIFTSSAPCRKHDIIQQQVVMESEIPNATPSSSRERSRSRSRAKSEERCLKSKVRPAKPKQKVHKKQVRMKPKVKYESDDKSLADSSDTCGDDNDETDDEKDAEEQDCSPVRPNKRARRKRAQTPDENDENESLGEASIDTQCDDAAEQGYDDYDSEASSAPTETPSRPGCSQKTRPRRKPILKKSPAPRGRQRKRSRSGRSRLVRSHIHTLDDHDRGSKCRLCTTCAARYQAILMNGRYA